MNVTLAYAYRGHAPNTTIDLPAAEARRLIANGEARRVMKAGPVPAPKPKPAPKPRRSRGKSNKEKP